MLIFVIHVIFINDFVDIKIKKLLDQSEVKYKILEHRKVYTAFNAAETQHVDSRQVVKTVFVKFSKPVMLSADNQIPAIGGGLVCVPAGKRIDLKKIAKAINDYQVKIYKAAKKINPKAKPPANIAAKLAGEKDITVKLKTKIGLISPFGRIFGLPVLMDKKLATNKKIIVSAGSYTESLELGVKDYIKLAQPIMGNFVE